MNRTIEQITRSSLLPGTCILSGILGVMIVSGCSGAIGGIDSDWVGERSVDGNVTTVRTLSGSVWGGKARLVEEASIGSETMGDEYLLARVRSITADTEHIYLLDTQVASVRVYDMNGVHMTDIGREGDGPGELRQPRSIAINPADGSLFIRDGQGARLNIYSPEGESLGRWTLFGGWSLSRQLVFADDGKLYTPAIQNHGVAPEDWRFGLISWGPEGALGDTIAEPVYEGFEPWQLVARYETGGTSASRVPFSPEVVWNVSWNRVLVSGVSTDYVIDVLFPDGRKTVIERDYEPVPVDPEEARWHRAVETVNMRSAQPGWAWNSRSIPRFKPPFNGLFPDFNDRIWVHRPGPGVIRPDGVEDPFENEGYWQAPYWVDSSIVDVFEFEGRFLGEVEIPDGFSFRIPPYIRGDMVIALVEGEDMIPRVKRFRLVLP